MITCDCFCPSVAYKASALVLILHCFYWLYLASHISSQVPQSATKLDKSGTFHIRSLSQNVLKSDLKMHGFDPFVLKCERRGVYTLPRSISIILFILVFPFIIYFFSDFIHLFMTYE